MITIEKLNRFGADTEDGLARCCGSEALYLRLVKMAAHEKSFDKLTRAANEKNYKEAFEAAHSLKGVLGNLSLTPLYDKVCEITELLGASEDADYAALTAETDGLREELRALCAD